MTAAIIPEGTPMAFSDFQYPDVLAKFGLTETVGDLFGSVPPLAPSEALRSQMPDFLILATTIHTEKARSELLVAPLLAETWVRMKGRVNLFSGVDFQADPEAKLTGYVDFLFGLGPQLFRPTAPVAVLFEAKRDSIPDGFGQCIAAMVGAQRFDERAGKPQPIIYGAVTTGSLWRFLTLSGSLVTFDATEYGIGQLDKLLGILNRIVDPPAR